ncbi:hypothetical protein ACEPPN_000714 [Leptodophora sp. 'Broadleaf-Isolate-01']
MLAYAGAKSPTKVTERAVLYESLGSTPKTDASSKKRAGSREDALDASTRTEKAPPTTVRSATTWESPWEKYEKIYDVELGGTIEVAIRKAPPVKLVHVRAFTTQAAPEDATRSVVDSFPVLPRTGTNCRSLPPAKNGLALVPDDQNGRWLV